jgi:hypothetical protein
MSQDLKIYKCSQCGLEIKAETKPQNCNSCNGTNFFIDLESREPNQSNFDNLEGVKNYSIDWCFCIDNTNSMTSFLENVKQQVIDFPKKLETDMREYRKIIDQHRIRIIVFSDFNLCPSEKAIISSPFFSLPNEQSSFEKFIKNIKPELETSNCSNSLEALALAIKSPWETNPIFRKKRQIIVLYTDKSAYPLENNSSQQISYLQDISKSFAQLMNEWDKLSLRSKRLVLFAPEVSPWNEIFNSCDNAIQFLSQAGEGLKNSEMDEILAVLHKNIA